jgi:hypothetical protein
MRPPAKKMPVITPNRSGERIRRIPIARLGALSGDPSGFRDGVCISKYAATDAIAMNTTADPSEAKNIRRFETIMPNVIFT